MRLGLTETNWSYVGAVLAQSDSGEQLEFFRAFVKECKSWGTRQQVEKQLAMVNADLTPDEREILAMLGYKGGK